METIKTDLVVVGAGPGGYTAAFYAADRGKKVILVEQSPRLGGVCLNRGCIPSKALLHATRLITEVTESGTRGIVFGKPKISLDKLRAWKESIIERLAQGLIGLGHKHGITVLHGKGHFEDSRLLRVETPQGQKFIAYEKAIIAVGTKPAMPAAFDLGNRRIMTSTEALELEEIPKNLFVVGGGYIGLELGTVYATLGSHVILAETMDSLLPEVDADLVRPVVRYTKKAFQEVRLRTKVLKMATSKKQIKVTMQVQHQKKEELYDWVLVTVGRIPNDSDMGLENTRVTKDENGFIQCNAKQQTSDPNIYSIGDVNGGPLLAHKATKEAKIAVEVITGESSTFDRVIIPAVIFTDPEVAWCGLTEREAREKNISIRIVKFPWSGSGKAMSMDRPDGLTKLIIEPETERILGVGIVGVGSGELISEGVLAMEMGATAKDLAESVHPHPTLSETLMECAESFYGPRINNVSRKKV
ncbi:MAG: dihydrolipoyl dehydrogenase [Candidatus Binatia bacterium]